MDTINLIAAAADNMAIGSKGRMPWHISADFKYFKRTTMSHTVVMGWRTWLSLGCKPLPGRRNIVISREPASEADLATGAEFHPSLDAALEAASGDGEIFIIGGGVIYSRSIDRADRIYLTRVHTVVEDADTFFPQLEDGSWNEVMRSIQYSDSKSCLDYEFIVYERKR